MELFRVISATQTEVLGSIFPNGHDERFGYISGSLCSSSYYAASHLARYIHIFDIFTSEIVSSISLDIFPNELTFSFGMLLGNWSEGIFCIDFRWKPNVEFVGFHGVLGNFGIEFSKVNFHSTELNLKVR